MPDFTPKNRKNFFSPVFFLLFPSRFPMTTTPAPPSRPPFGQDGGAKFKARDGKSTPLRSVRTERCLSTRFPTLPSHLFVRSRHRRNATFTRHHAPHTVRGNVRNFTCHFVRIRHISMFFKSFLQINSLFVRHHLVALSFPLPRYSDIFRQKKPPLRELVRDAVKCPKKPEHGSGAQDGTDVFRTLLCKVTAALCASLCRSALSRLNAKTTL